MIRIAVVGGIGSGKTYVSKLFKFPVFNADKIVSNIYIKDKKVFKKLKKKIPNIFSKLPIKKDELIKAILRDKNNINIISSIVHPVVKKHLNFFLSKYRKKKFVVLDIPLFLEKKLYKKGDIVIFIQSKKEDVQKKIKKRKNYNKLILKKLKSLQIKLSIKKKKSHFIIKNDFKKDTTRKKVRDILRIINYERNSIRY